MIPYCYFEYLRTHQAFQLVRFFTTRDGHCVAGLPDGGGSFAFRSPEDTSLRHGADLVGWPLAGASERYEEAVRLYRRAVDLGLRDDLLFKTQWEIGRLEKKLER